MSNEMRDERVLVTGGSGYVGGWMLVGLLRQGYRVRTTVRDLGREAPVRAALARQVDPGDRLSFVAADLLDDAGWDRAADGVDFILHVASPLGAGEEVIAPAREGTLRVLRAGQKAGVKRVVITSSLVAARPAEFEGEGFRRHTDESQWTELNGPGVTPYVRAKTLAEQDAWDYVRHAGGGMTLATVLPGFILGPVLGPDPSASVELVARLLGGRMPGLPRLGFSVVDVRDLVDLHLRAMRTPEAGGHRFLATSGFLWLADMARVLRERLGERAAKVPTRELPDILVRLLAWFNAELRQLTPDLGQRREFTPAKAEQLLGWRARPPEASLVDCAESLTGAGPG